MEAEISNLTELQYLTMSYGKLNKIDAQLSQLKKLKHLDLSYNELRSLPDDFKNFKNIRINLSKNLFSIEEKNKITKWFTAADQVELIW